MKTHSNVIDRCVKYDLEIVSHCYAKSVPIYRAHLQYQAASIYRFSPKDRKTCYTVFVSRNDMTTVCLAQAIQDTMPEHVTMNVVELEDGHLFRRAIGRNLRALAGEANVYWFTDVDYAFGWNCFNSLLWQVGASTGLVFPQSVWMNPSHAIGDRMCEGLERDCVFHIPKIDRQHFVRRKQRTCIGGAHVIGRDKLLAIDDKTGKPHGYINGHRKCTPVDPKDGFRSCRCDVPFKAAHRPAMPIEIDGVYRIRHTVAGRCYDVDGNRTVKMKGDHD